uniref:Ku70/Ku80 C-terminal arm domain-containing protein n=1 Tax=Fagus sylvatica TaxID=28930 RepID=A0A2N9I3L5_FAGSY
MLVLNQSSPVSRFGTRRVFFIISAWPSSASKFPPISSLSLTNLLENSQNEIISHGGQVEPPGMHMIYLPYSEDIRHVEELYSDSNGATPKATDDQIKKATALMKRIDLKDFSVCQFSNPALQRHYAVLQALALEEPDIPETKDETLPDEEGMARPGVVSAVEEFKLSVYGDNYDEENELVRNGKASEASKKRKAIADNAVKECANYNWADLADNGQVKLEVSLLSYFIPSDANQRETFELFYFDKVKLSRPFSVEGFDSGGVEILLDSTQPSCYWKEGGFGQQDINTHGKVSDLRLTENILCK